MASTVDTPRPSRPPTHGYHVQETISSSLDEGLVPIFLFDLASYINAQTLPAPKFVQILLHLLLTDQAYPDVTPLALLQTLVTLHQTEDLEHLLPVPGDARASWEPRGRLEAEAKRRMRLCKDEGIWALLWNTRARAVADANGDVKREKVVSERGWDVLDWLVFLWKHDQEQYTASHPDQRPISPLFLAQLPRKAADLQLDDATSILAVVRSAYSLPPGMSTRRQRTLADQTLHLLTDAVLGPSPPFHPQSYILAVLSLFRSLSPRALSELVADMRHHLVSIKAEQYSLLHILTIYLEDLGGTRQAKADRRRQRPRNTDTVDPEDGLLYDKTYGSFPIPSVAYFTDLLGLAPREDVSDARARMSVVKPRLLLLLQSIHQPSSAEWSSIRDKLPEVGDTVDPSAMSALAALLQ